MVPNHAKRLIESNSVSPNQRDHFSRYLKYRYFKFNLELRIKSKTLLDFFFFRLIFLKGSKKNWVPNKII